MCCDTSVSIRRRDGYVQPTGIATHSSHSFAHCMSAASAPSQLIKIADLDKAQLLLACWSCAHSYAMTSMHPAGFGELREGPPTLEKAREALESCEGNIDYFHGRPIKVDFSHDYADYRSFDKDSGAGAFAKAIDLCRMRGGSRERHRAAERRTDSCEFLD